MKRFIALLTLTLVMAFGVQTAQAGVGDVVKSTIGYVLAPVTIVKDLGLALVKTGLETLDGVYTSVEEAVTDVSDEVTTDPYTVK